MTLVFKSLGIWDGIVNPIYECWVKITPDINPKNVRLGRACPGDSKNISFIDVEHVETGLGWFEII